MRDADTQVEEGEVDTAEPQPTKVYIRGFDHNWKPADLRNYVREAAYGVDAQFKRIEWINDTSANLLYETDDAAIEALGLFSADGIVGERLEEREAKKAEAHPDSSLVVRQAVVGDVKIERAAQYSKFYLHNPAYDPSERKRKRHDDHRERAVYRKREGYDRRRNDNQEQPFDVNLYDDDDDSAMQTRRRSASSGSGVASSRHSRRQLAHDDVDLFAGKQSGRLRGARSASPGRDGDGRYGFAENEGASKRQAPRAISPPASRASQSLNNRVARDVMKTELFPNRSSNNDLFPSKRQHTLGDNNSNNDLLSSRGATTADRSRPRDLFPSSPSHRRQDAQDMKLIDVAEQIGKYHLDSNTGSDRPDPHAYQPPGRAPSQTRIGASRGGDLFSRVSGGPGTKSSERGRLRAQEESPGFSFKGAAGLGAGSDAPSGNGSSGFSIRGASKEKVENPLVKELFPIKAGAGSGNGKDLFDGRIKGRGRGKRMGAGDLI